MSKITLDNLSEKLKEYIESTGMTEDQVINIVKNNLSGDLSGLNTSDKSSLVAAINELFQSANNGKELIATAIGEPLSSSDTFSAMGNGINSLNSQFKSALMNNGVSVTSTDKFKQLIEKLALLSASEGKGIKFAEGTISESITITSPLVGSTHTVNHNLGFTPNIIFVNIDLSTNNASFPSANKIIVSNLETSTVQAYYDRNGLSVIINNITQNSFDIFVSSNKADFTMYATFNDWYAIGVGEEDTTLEDTLRDLLRNKGIEVTPEDDLASLITKVGNINITPVPAWYNKGFFINSSTALSQSRAKASACTAKGKIYVMGGRTTATNYTTIYSTNECYDPNKNTIVTKNSLPYKVSELMLNNINDNIYCIGGNDGSKDLGLNLLYDVSNDTFTEKTKSRNTDTRWGYAGTCTVENKIHHIGNNIHNVYDPITNTWTTAQSTKIETYVYGMQVHSYNKKIYVITHSYVSPYVFIYMYDTISNTWTSIANTGGMSGFYECSAIVDDKIFIFGGQENYIYSNYFDITKNKLVNNVNNQTTGRTYMACSAYNNTIYLFGGSVYNSTTNVYNVIMAYAVTN